MKLKNAECTTTAFVSVSYCGCKTKARRYSDDDQHFIAVETKRLLHEGIVEASDSPWRAQIFVAKNEGHKKCMVMDYLQRINRFIQLDASPIQRIDETVKKIALDRGYSPIDLKCAYHQVPIKEDEKHYTAYEASKSLYQFRSLQSWEWFHERGAKKFLHQEGIATSCTTSYNPAGN